MKTPTLRQAFLGLVASMLGGLSASGQGAGILIDPVDPTQPSFVTILSTPGMANAEGLNFPTALTLSNQLISAGVSPGAFVGSLSVTDSDIGDSHQFTLAGASNLSDNQFFRIRENVLETNATLDYGSKPTLTARIQVIDSAGLSLTKVFVIRLVPTDSSLDTDGDGIPDATEISQGTDPTQSPPNQAPVFSGGSPTFTTPESNVSASFGISATDPDGDALAYSITGGADQAKFDLNSSTGVLSFKATPDFEHPSDTNGDNAYLVTIRVSDGTADANRTFTVNVTDLQEIIPPLKTVSAGIYQLNATPSSNGHQVALSAFTIEANELPFSYWQDVYNWAIQNGYAFSNPGSAFGPDHPVHSVNWYDVVKWANARSEKEGLTPCYYLDANRTQVYRTGGVDVSNHMVDWLAEGYRLPTEAEWEVAARGGLENKNYAWGDSPSTAQANYLDSGLGQTSALGLYPANGYGLREVGGNLREWVWDWNDTNSYEYDFKETFSDANGSYDLIDENGTSAIFNTQKFLTTGEIASDPSTSNYVGPSDWFAAKTITLGDEALVFEVSNEIKSGAGYSNKTGSCKIKFLYLDGSTAFSSSNSQNFTWTGKTYANPYPSRSVDKIEVWLYKGTPSYSSGQTLYGGTLDRNTIVTGRRLTSSFVTLHIPQLKEGNATHFRVKIETDREGDDDIWFQLFDGDQNKTYANSDFDKLLPVTYPINQPGKLRIYLKPKSTNPTPGGTALKAVYWGTSNPKSIWTGSKRVVRDNHFGQSLKTLDQRSSFMPNVVNSTIGFRLVRRPPPNRPPVFVAGSSTFTVSENNSSASFHLNATDPDGDVLAYSIAGGNDATKFDLNSSTGVLAFKNAPDFEANASAAGNNAYIVIAQVSDGTLDVNQTVTINVTDVYEVPPDQTGGNENNSTTENNTTTNPGDSNATQTDSNSSTTDSNSTQPPPIELFRPVVESREAKKIFGTSATLRGKLVDDGGSPVTERGFLLSPKPNPKPGRPNVQRLVAENGPGIFKADATNLKPGKKYFYRAFATNQEGTSLGSVETFTTTAGPLSPSWINAQPGTAANWWTSPWFGNFYLNANGWARHEKLGWVFPMESPTAGLWLWKEGMGWLWTDKGIYPFLYDNNGGGWLYFYGQHEGTKLFYDYVRKKWTTLKEN